MPLTLPSELKERLQGIRSAAVVTGAGISAESGIQTYRGMGGLYDDPVHGDATVDALSGTTLVTDPDRTWRTIAGLARQASKAEPNAGHRALVAMEKSLDHFVLLTQNVDGLHRAAGSQNLIEIHGHLRTTTCTQCSDQAPCTAADLATFEVSPLCKKCASILRPDVVLFGEMLPLMEVGRIHSEIYQHTIDLTLVVGTSALFPYITEPVQVARAAGHLTVEIDPESTALSQHVDFALKGKAGEWLPLLAAAIS